MPDWSKCFSSHESGSESVTLTALKSLLRFAEKGLIAKFQEALSHSRADHTSVNQAISAFGNSSCAKAPFTAISSSSAAKKAK